MSGVTLPVSRPTGRSLLVGGLAGRAKPAAILRRLGCTCVETDDAYSAMAELAQRGHSYSSVVLSLGTIFREELQIITAAKRRCPNLEIWLTQTDGRQPTVDEAMTLGADGFLSDDGFHRAAQPTPAPPPAAPPQLPDEPDPEPVLSAEELRALLEDPPP